MIETVALALMFALPVPTIIWLVWLRVDFPLYRGQPYPPWWSLAGDGLLWAGWAFGLTVLLVHYVQTTP
jgi:hypothetical protein